MADLDKALATQLANIEKRTGKSLAELTAIVKSSGLSKHGELVAMLKSTLGMGHGDANTLVHTVRKSEEQHACASRPMHRRVGGRDTDLADEREAQAEDDRRRPRAQCWVPCGAVPAVHRMSGPTLELIHRTAPNPRPVNRACEWRSVGAACLSDRHSRVGCRSRQA